MRITLRFGRFVPVRTGAEMIEPPGALTTHLGILDGVIKTTTKKKEDSAPAAA